MKRRGESERKLECWNGGGNATGLTAAIVWDAWMRGRQEDRKTVLEDYAEPDGVGSYICRLGEPYDYTVRRS